MVVLVILHLAPTREYLPTDDRCNLAPLRICVYGVKLDLLSHNENKDTCLWVIFFMENSDPKYALKPISIKNCVS